MDIGTLGNFAGYVGKGSGHTISGLSSAYATNASDLIRGFKSSQSIPVVSSAQASIHQVSKQSRDSSLHNANSK